MVYNAGARRWRTFYQQWAIIVSRIARAYRDAPEKGLPNTLSRRGMKERQDQTDLGAELL
jgi:hypothetical protein